MRCLSIFLPTMSQRHLLCSLAILITRGCYLERFGIPRIGVTYLRWVSPAACSPPRKRGGSFLFRGASRTSPYIEVKCGKIRFARAAGCIRSASLPAPTINWSGRGCYFAFIRLLHSRHPYLESCYNRSLHGRCSTAHGLDDVLRIQLLDLVTVDFYKSTRFMATPLFLWY